MADLETLKALRERVLKAEGPDEDIDVAVMLACDDRLRYRLSTPIYTASIDAALALVERCLPGWDYGFDLFHDEGRAALTHSAYVGSPANEEREHHSFPRRAASLPLALLLALIDALIAQQEQGRG